MIKKVISFLENNSKLFLYISLVLCFIFSCLLFNIKISESADDSGYIEGAWKFMNGLSFPTWHGTFYQIFLSIFIEIFGMNIIVLKFLSLILITFHLYWLFVTFQNKIPSYILPLTLIFLGINADILVYSSLTYSEALYFVLQIVCVYYVFEIIKKIDLNIPLTKLWKEWAILGLFMFLLGITRNIGIAMVVSTVILFLIYRNWLASLFAAIPYVVYQILFLIYKHLFWSFSKVGIEDQFNAMFLKDTYNPALGNETLKGFIERFLTNMHQYLSGHLLSFFGIQLDISSTFSIFITAICLLVFFFILRKYIKKDKYFGFIGIYIFIALCATFISQQVFWNQGRLVLVYLPFVFILLFSWLYDIASKSKNAFIKVMPFAIGIILTFLVLMNTITKIEENLPILSENLSNDKYYGFSEDCANYLKLSEWCSNNVPNETVVACRKPSMSFIYANEIEFTGLYQFPIFSVDSFIYAAMGKPSLLVFNLDEMKSKLSREKQLIFRQNLWAILISNKSGIGIILLDSLNKDNLISKTLQYKLQHTYSSDTLNMIIRNEPCSIVYPDSLLNNLKSKKIQYIIDAKSDISNTNNPLFVNVMKRYVFLIAQKYPSLFELVRTEGSSNSASLYKIHWEKIKN